MSSSLTLEEMDMSVVIREVIFIGLMREYNIRSLDVSDDASCGVVHKFNAHLSDTSSRAWLIPVSPLCPIKVLKSVAYRSFRERG